MRPTFDVTRASNLRYLALHPTSRRDHDPVAHCDRKNRVAINRLPDERSERINRVPELHRDRGLSGNHELGAQGLTWSNRCRSGVLGMPPGGLTAMAVRRNGSN